MSPQPNIPEFSDHPQNIQYTVKTARLLNQTETGIARVFADQSDNFLERQYGTVFAVIDLDFTSDFYDISEVVIDTLTREYFSDLNRPAVRSFEHALTVVNQTLADLAAEGQNDWVGKLNALVGVVHENEIHLSLVGRAEAYLVRGPSVTHITADLRPTTQSATAKTFTNIASGELEVGDKLLFATNEVFNHLSQNDVRRHLYLHPPTRAIRKIADQLTDNKRPGRLAGAVVELTTIDLISAETVSDEPDEIILGAPRGHFESLQKLRPFREDTPIADLAGKARKHWEKRIQPGLKRTVETTSHSARSWVARRRGQAPPPPPPRHAAGTPETPHHHPERHAPSESPAPGIADRIKPALDSAERSLRQAGRTVRHHTQRLWQKSGIPKTRAWQTIRRVTAPATTRLAALWRKAGTGGRPALYRNLIIGIALVFLISLFFSIRAAENRKADAKVRDRINRVEEIQAKAEERYIFKDLAGARQRIDEAKQQADDLARQKRLKPQVAKLEQSVGDSYARINNIVSVPAQPLADFSAAAGKTTLTHLVQSGTTLYAIGETGGLETFNQTSHDIKTLSATAVPAGSKAQALATTTNGDVLLLTDKPAVLTIDQDNGSISEASLATGAAWEAGTALDTVDQNIYILDPAKNQIWRHDRTQSGYGKGTAYVNGQVDLKNSTGLVTGAQVFVLKSTGEVIQFAGGNPTPLKLAGTPTPNNTIKNASAIGMNFASNLVYIADPGNHRVLEYNAKGEYQRQFTSDAFGAVKALSVDDKTNSLFVLAGNKVYQIKLG